MDINGSHYPSQSAFTETLELKHLSKVSDEDARKVCESLNIISSDYPWSVNIATLNQFSFDYLRSKGYALDWLEFSVEEMIEAGWVRLAQ